MGIAGKFQTILAGVRAKDRVYARVAVIGAASDADGADITQDASARGAGIAQDAGARGVSDEDKARLTRAIIGRAVSVCADRTTGVLTHSFENAAVLDLPPYPATSFSWEAWATPLPLQKCDIFVFAFRGALSATDLRVLAHLRAMQTERPRPILYVCVAAGVIADAERAQIADALRTAISLRETPPVHFVDLCAEPVDATTLRRAIWTADLRALYAERMQQAFQKALDMYLKLAETFASERIESKRKWAALSGINPIFGMDVAVDLAICHSLFKGIRAAYEIDDADLERYITFPAAKKLWMLMTKEGITILLKRIATKVAIRGATKYIPVVGTVAAGAMNAHLLETMGQDYEADCRAMATSIMQEMIDAEMQKLGCARPRSVV